MIDLVDVLGEASIEDLLKGIICANKYLYDDCYLGLDHMDVITKFVRSITHSVEHKDKEVSSFIKETYEKFKKCVEFDEKLIHDKEHIKNISFFIIEYDGFKFVSKCESILVNNKINVNLVNFVKMNISSFKCGNNMATKYEIIKPFLMDIKI